MEEADVDARLLADAEEPPLGFEQFKAGAKKAAILVAVGIAQHDFLPATAVVHGFFDNAGGEEFLHDFGSGA